MGLDLKPRRARDACQGGFRESLRFNMENVIRSAVVYVIDEKGYELARHAATSFILTQASFQDVHLFCDSFSPSPSDRLTELGRERGVRVHIEPIDNRHTEITQGQITKTHFLKLEAVDRIVKAYDRVLYVDNDILFFDEIFLERIDLEGLPVGAVYDIAETGCLTNPDFIKDCRRNNRSPHYFNSGFMLFDSSKWSHEFKDIFLQFSLEHKLKCDYKQNCTLNDQCSFNRLFENNWKRLPLNFNVQACAKFTGRWDRALVRHYQGPSKFIPVRPWRNDARDMRLIKGIRLALGYKDRSYPPSNILFGLNAFKRRAWIEKVNEGLELLELMACEPMPAR
jgi:lipopolysaccharide biosynthesis glycosyltransferase